MNAGIENRRDEGLVTPNGVKLHSDEAVDDLRGTLRQKSFEGAHVSIQRIVNSDERALFCSSFASISAISSARCLSISS